MTYELHITNKENLQTLNIKIEGELKKEDKKLFKDHASQLFSKSAELSGRTVTLEDLKSRLSLIKEEDHQNFNISLKKIQQLQALPSPKVFLSRREMFREVLKEQPEVPLKILWVLFIAPFLTLFRFHRQNLSSELNKIFDGEVSTQDQLLYTFEHAKDKLNSETTPKPILDYLDQTIKNGINLKGLSEEEIKLYFLDQIQKQQENQEEALLGSIPVTIEIQGTATPLLFTFHKLKGYVYLELAGLPENTLLRSSYEFSFDLAKDIIPSLISSILYAYAIPLTKSDKIHLSQRQKTQLKNIQYLFQPGKKSESPQISPERYLNEMIVNFAIPLKETRQTQPNLFLELYEKLGDLSDIKIDRLEWLLTSVEEEMQSLMPVLHKLPSEAALSFLDRLEGQLRIIEKKIEDPTNPKFKAFFEQLEAFKKVKPKFQATLLSLQSPLQKQTITTESEQKTKINLKKLNPLSHLQTHLKTPSLENSVVDVDFKGLEAAVKADRISEVNKELKLFHQKIDQAIENQNFTYARKVALEVLKKLPVPDSIDAHYLWDKRSQEISLETSFNITNLAKDLWECSLKLGEFTPDPELLIQLMKAQVINVLLLQYSGGNTETLDYTEIENLIYLHPHIRFGFKPDQMKELDDLKTFIENRCKTARNKIGRFDGVIKNKGLRDFPKYPLERRKDGLFQMQTDFTRLQVMLTTVLKPDYCLTPFFGRGTVESVKAFKWIEGLKKEASKSIKNKDDPAELQTQIILLRRKMIMDKLKKMKRLELGVGDYNTETCITLVDPKTSLTDHILAYLPNGPGLPSDLAKRYNLQATEINTENLAGAYRGEAVFLGSQDQKDVADLEDRGEFLKGLADSLSPQIAYTEPGLLAKNYQEKPIGQISQVDNYLLELTQISHPSSKSRSLDPGSVLEALNIIFNEQHLTNPEVQRSILMVLTRTFLLNRAYETSTKEILAIAMQLQDLTKKYLMNAEIAPFLILVGQLIRNQHDAFAYTSPAMDEIAEKIPSFENKIRSEKGEDQTGKAWLEKFLHNPDMSHSSASVAYLYCMMGRPLDKIDADTVANLLYASALFDKMADLQSIPGLNKMVSKWIHQELLPNLISRVKDSPDLNKKWLELALKGNHHFNTSGWRIQQEAPLIYENSDFSLHFSSLEIISKKTGASLLSSQVILPEIITNHPSFLSLFNEKEIKASITGTGAVDQYIYTFKHEKQEYRILHNQTQSEIKIYAKLAKNPFNSKSKKEWFEYVPEMAVTGDTTLEMIIAKKGIWVNSNHPTKAYLFTSSLTDANSKNSFALSFDKEGFLIKAQSIHNYEKVAFLTKKETENILPFADGNTTLILTSRNQLKGAYLTEDRTLLQKQKTGWSYDNPKIGQRWTWRADLLKQDGLQENYFLRSLKSDWPSFLIPLEREGRHQYVVIPSEIKVLGDGRLSFVKDSLSAISHLNPMTLAGEQELEGSPSSYLYLAYYFCMKKDYPRALFYLEKASKAPASSQQELEMFQYVAKLFENIPYRGLESLHFQLKAQLVIQRILKTQFSQTHYVRDNEESYRSNVTYISHIYSEYHKKVAGSAIYRFKEKEIEELESFLWSSFKQWIDLQPKAPSLQADQLEQTELENTTFKEDFFAPLESATLLALLIPAKSLTKPLSKAELIKNRFLQKDFLLEHFYDFCVAIKNIKTSEEALEWLRYLGQTPLWSLKKDSDHPELTSLANEARRFLIAAALMSRENVDLFDIDLPTLQLIKEQLPKYDASTSLFALIYSRLGLTQQLNESASFSEGFNKLLQKASSLFKGKTLGTVLSKNKFKPVFEKVETKEKNSTSFEAIRAYFQNLPQDHRFLPLEVELIPLMIEEGDLKDEDLKKLRSLQQISKEFETQKYPMTQLRALGENMRKIQNVESVLSEKLKNRLENSKKISGFAPVNLAEKEAALKEEIKKFSAMPEDIQLKLNKIEKQTKTAKHYFDSAQTASPSLKEEYSQFIKGLENAQNLLSEEARKKVTFSEAELKEFQTFLSRQLDNSPGSLRFFYQQNRENLFNSFKNLEALPNQLEKMLSMPDLYSDIEVFHEIERLFKNPKYGESHALNVEIAETLLYLTAVQQFEKAARFLKEGNPATALEHVLSGLELNRYAKAENGLIARKCLVAEARAGIIFRPGQRRIIQQIAKDPSQWASLRMGLGKTSYAMPAIAEILAEMGHSVVLTVPEKLLRSNRLDIDKATRVLFDQAGMEFTLPLQQDLPLNVLAEKVLQIEQIFLKKGYIITTVEELATLHNTCIMLEEEKRKIHEAKEIDKFTEIEAQELFQLQLRLHYYKKIDQILNNDSSELTLNGIFFGDETDETHHITHEVSIALGGSDEPSKVVRNVSKILLNEILQNSKDPALLKLKELLLNDTYTTLKDKQEILSYMRILAVHLKSSPHFLALLGDQADTVKSIDEKEWSSYLVGELDHPPKGLPNWDQTLKHSLAPIAATKQLLSKTLIDLLGMKSGNDFGLSDYQGFVVVPKTTKNETQGMRFGDEFEMILAQYIGYLEYMPAKSLTETSDQFLKEALKGLKEKNPQSYDQLLKDYLKYNERGHHLEILDYIKLPEAYAHRWSVLDEIVFDGGYLKRYKEQIRTNVQELFHKKATGGVTGTLDPYSLPYISEEVLLHINNDSSTREVEAETFLRMGLNLEKGLDQPVQTYQDREALSTIKQILKDSTTTAIINNSGATSEGLNTYDWIASLRTLDEGKKRSYLFMHPQERTAYLWVNDAEKAVPYKGQKLPDNTICIYAPSDVRGVDLPIRKGKVHMLTSTTATPAELVQSLYRARKLGGDHQLILYISQALQSKIKEIHTDTENVTYGHVIQYLISRSNARKLEQNEAAQLTRIQFELKTALTRFLKKTDPDYNLPTFMDKKNVEKVIKTTKAEAEIFKVLRDYYIKSKEINFEDFYTPLQKGSGLEKIFQEYDNLEKTIQSLLPEIKEASEKSLLYNFDEKLDVQTKAKELTETFILLKREHPEIAHNYAKEIKTFLSNPTEVDAISQFHRFLNQELKNLKNRDLINRFQNQQKFLTEMVYGKGKTYLYNDLILLKANIKNLKAQFEAHQDLHKKYLPEQSILNAKGHSGSQEQVKVMQKQQTKEIQQIDSDSNRAVSNAQNDSQYLSLDPTRLLSNRKMPLELPLFDGTGISDEAGRLLDTVGLLKGDPLFYVTVDHSGSNPSFSLITKLDYHYSLKPAIMSSKFDHLAVYLPTPSGYRFVNGGHQRDLNSDIPKEQIFRLMTIKAFLGYKNEFMKNDQGKWKESVLEWSKSLDPQVKQNLLSHIQKRGTPSQQALFTELLS